MDNNQRRGKARPGFHDKSVRGLSFAITVIGCLCFGIGVGVLVYSLVIECKYRHSHNYYSLYTTAPVYYAPCHYFRTYSSAGIWSGLMFIASGVIGALASRRKTTCYIVSMMVLSIVSTWIAVGGATIAALANFDNIWYGDYYNERVGNYPLELLIPNCVIALFCFIVFILSWINFGFACHAVCCNGQAGLPSIKERNAYQYQTLQNAPSPMMYATQPMTTQGANLPAVGAPTVPVFQPLPHPHPAALEPVYLVQGRQIIGMLPQNPQVPVMGNTAVQLNPATATTSAVPPQQV